MTIFQRSILVLMMALNIGLVFLLISLGAYWFTPISVCVVALCLWAYFG